MAIFTSRKSRNKGGKDSPIIFRFLKFLRPYWLKGLFAFFFMLFAVALQLPMPFLTKYLIDKVLVMKSFRVLNIIGFVLIGVLFLRAFSIVSKGKTLLIIAHRLATVKDADKIIVLNKGKIEGIGTHKELLSRSKVYQSLYKKG